MESAPAAATAAAPPAPPLRSAPVGRRLGVRVARWVGELVTVFVGVYAAFMFNNYQAHRQERQRREQILAWAQREYTEALTFATHETEHLRRAAAEFDRRVQAGDPPAIRPFNFLTDYNPTDFTSMLQSGGFDLLEVETLRDIREVEGSLRQWFEVIRHTQQLSDALILPNLDKAPEVFYDPATRQLRPGYGWYRDYFTTQLAILEQMHTDLVKVLAQLRAERERNR